MTSLFNKFRETVNAVAKTRALLRNPRQLQFEKDINLLFLYTSYKRLGKEAEEAELNEIIDMACKASVADQQALVQENIHRQICNFCNVMDTILLGPQQVETSPKSPVNLEEASRPSGLSFAVGNAVQTNLISGKFNYFSILQIISIFSRTDVRETKSLNREEVSALLKNTIGYSLAIERSRIAHKEAGEGLFVKGEAGVGSIIAFYPGMVYEPAYYRYIPGYPIVDAENSNLVARYDDAVIDAKPWKKGGDSREKWHSVGSSSNAQILEDSGRIWKMLSKPLVGAPFEGEIDVIERRNPLALGHFANHPVKGTFPNVMLCPYDFPLEEKKMRAYIPNVMFGRGGNVAMKRFGRFWFKMWRRGKGEVIGRLKCLILVATKDICDEEVMINYRLSNAKRRPSWYQPVDEEEDSRRWS